MHMHFEMAFTLKSDFWLATRPLCALVCIDIGKCTKPNAINTMATMRTSARDRWQMNENKNDTQYPNAMRISKWSNKRMQCIGTHIDWGSSMTAFNLLDVNFHWNAMWYSDFYSSQLKQVNQADFQINDWISSM